MATLPILPGFTFTRNSKVGQTHFPRKQCFDVANNVHVLNEKPAKDPAKDFSVFPPGEGPAIPVWVAFDKKALCFLGYWQEGIHDLPLESYRVYKVKIFLYLEDDSIQITRCRPPVSSGLDDGFVHRYVLVRRHRIRMPPPKEDHFYNLDHLRIGNDIEVYGKKFHIAACGDKFTENFLTRMGFKLPPPEEIPQDSGTQQILKQKNSELMPLFPYVKTNWLRKFLEHDREVLRFYGYWDDTESLYGDMREIIFLYFLGEDAVEIREKIRPNSGRDTFPIILRKRKLPKKWVASSVPGLFEDFTLLNVLGNANRYAIQDKLQAGVFPTIEYYKDSDFMIGSVINALGRKIMLCDCDDFTKNYYRSKFSIDDFTPLIPAQLTEKKEPIQHTIPPHIGFGSEEDTLSNVFKLVPKKPFGNFTKFITLDGRKDESNVLRFAAQLANLQQLSRYRKFVLNVYLVDDSVMVYEAPLRNSGFPGGRFIGRMRMKKPMTPNPPVGVHSSVYYKPEDFYIGAVVKLNNYQFIIVDADEYCLKQMEDHPEIFPKADIKCITQKIRGTFEGNGTHDLKQALEYADPENTGKLEFYTFKHVLSGFVDIVLLTEHEYITIGRHYNKELMADLYSLDTLQSIAQRELARHSFLDFDELYKHVRHYDMPRIGKLDRLSIYKALRSYPLPLCSGLLHLFAEKLEPAEADEIDYKYMVNLLDYNKFPCEHTVSSHVVFDTIRMETQPKLGPVQHLVDYRRFLIDIEEGVDMSEKI